MKGGGEEVAIRPTAARGMGFRLVANRKNQIKLVNCNYRSREIAVHTHGLLLFSHSMWMVPSRIFLAHCQQAALSMSLCVYKLKSHILAPSA